MPLMNTLSEATGSEQYITSKHDHDTGQRNDVSGSDPCQAGCDTLGVLCSRLSTPVTC